MSLWLTIEARFLHGRYHGRGDWPPTPLRLFQAVVAGALSGRWAVEDREDTETALRWWEDLRAPALVLAPAAARALRPYRLAVPPNQADRHLPALKKGARLEKLLAGEKDLKHVTPRHVGRDPIVYAWPIHEGDRARAEALRPIIRRLVALGHGIDHAVADAKLCSDKPERLGLVAHSPGPSPCPGTLESLKDRHQATLARLAKGGLNEALPPIVALPGADRAAAAVPILFTLRDATGEGFAPVDPFLTAVLAHAVRLRLAERLRYAVLDAEQRARGSASRATFTVDDVDRIVIGRSKAPEDVVRRPIFLPLPSVGHEHADGLVRRMLVIVPPECPATPDAVRNALRGQTIEVGGPEVIRLLPSEIDGVAATFLPKERRKIWETVSPILVRSKGARWPRLARGGEEQSGEADRAEAKRRERVAGMIERALAQAGHDPAQVSFEMRREPWSARQPRADGSWRTPLNDDRRNWLADRHRVHLRVAFETPLPGPLVIGDGRYLGLGLMRPVPEQARDAPNEGLHVFDIVDGPTLRPASHEAFTRALRRAVLARADAVRVARPERGGGLPLFFHGHVDDGAAGRDGTHRHLFFALDPPRGPRAARALILAPHHGDRSPQVLHATRRFLGRLAKAVEDLSDLRAGTLGRFALAPASVEADDRLLGSARRWTSLTDYQPTRYPRRGEEEAKFLAADLRAEAQARGLPRPWVDILSVSRGPRDGLSARARITFAIPVAGPLLLGRNSHFGGGLFERDG